jgi:hypothetical protein
MLDKDFSSTKREPATFFERKIKLWEQSSVNVMPITVRRPGILSLSFLPGVGSMQKEERDKAVADFGEGVTSREEEENERD